MQRLSITDPAFIVNPELLEKLASRGLDCHLLTAESSKAKEFPSLLCKELIKLTSAAYRRQLTPAHLEYETWAVTLRKTEEPHEMVACGTMCFYSDLPSYFKTHFEAVHPSHQCAGLGRLLFECIASWARVLVLRDPIVIEGVMQSKGTYCIAATIDRDDDDNEDFNTTPMDNEAGHGTFLKKLGFQRATHDFRPDLETEICLQLEFHLPIHDCLEEEHALPARPDSA